MGLGEEKQAFTKRLKDALRKAGVDTGSYTRVAREFNLRYPGDPVSTQAVRKWVMGEALPSQDKIRALGLWLDVGAQWLRFGDGDRRQDRAQLAARQEPAYYKAELTWVSRKFEQLEDPHKKMILEMVLALLRLEGK